LSIALPQPPMASPCLNEAAITTMMMMMVTMMMMMSNCQVYIFRVERGPFREEFYQCVTFGAYTARWQEQLYSTVSLLLMYVIPLVTMVTAYLLIFITITHKSRDFLHQGELSVGAKDER